MFGLIAKILSARAAGLPARRSILRVEPLEDRTVPAGQFVVGVGGATSPNDPEVSLRRASGSGSTVQQQLEAFTGTGGDTRVAVGDVNGDGTDDIIAASGVGGSEVVIFDGAKAAAGSQAVIARFTAYANFAGGVFVAAADLNGDGYAEVITTPGRGGRGHLKVFNFHTSAGFLGSAPALLTSAYTFTDYNGEVRVAALQSGGQEYVVTASGAGVAGDVRAYRQADRIGGLADGTAVPANFLAARVVPGGGYAGGLSVAAADTDGDGSDELVVTRNSGPSVVEVYTVAPPRTGSGGFNLLGTFEAFAGFQGEVRVGSADVNGDGKDEVLVTTGSSGDARGTPVKAFARSGTGFGLASAYYANPGYANGAWLAAHGFTAQGRLAGGAGTGGGSTINVGNPGATALIPAQANYDLLVVGSAYYGSTNFISNATQFYSPVAFARQGVLAVRPTVDGTNIAGNGVNRRDVLISTGDVGNGGTGVVNFATNSLLLRLLGGNFAQAAALDVAYVSTDTAAGTIHIQVDNRVARTTQLNTLFRSGGLLALPFQITYGVIDLQFSNGGQNLSGSMTLFGEGYIEPGTAAVQANIIGAIR